MNRLRACLLLLLVIAVEPTGAHAQSFELLDASRFWIRGTSSVNTFTCRAPYVRAAGRLPLSQPVRARPDSLQPRLAVPVQRFDCGNDRMTNDLKETLKAQAHPTIRFQLQRVERVVPPDTTGGWYRLHVLGTLTVAGTERLVRVSARGQRLGPGTYRVTGCKPLHMTYFGITPPTKFMGLIEVHDRIQVHFDLAVQVASATPAVAAVTAPAPTPSCSSN
ncbi:YceI family protein [Salisaeta longa]|uniref:YceI family protein n=1 Tax=Salisaeta longa TaxID=503170 RepID=UPI000A054BD0|nr:YceI family protein [Salisaeta longa]